jgi:hypothetical protein
MEEIHPLKSILKQLEVSLDGIFAYCDHLLRFYQISSHGTKGLFGELSQTVCEVHEYIDDDCHVLTTIFLEVGEAEHSSINFLISKLENDIFQNHRGDILD